MQYHEATGDSAVLSAVERNLKAMLRILDRVPLFSWGKLRWFEGLISAYYVHERTGEIWLLDLARKLQSQGFNYMHFYAGKDVTQPTPRRGRWRFDKHVVNTGMALKAYALSSRLTRREAERTFPARMLKILDRYHGQVHGMFTGAVWKVAKQSVLAAGVERRLWSLMPAPLRPGMDYEFCSPKLKTREEFLILVSFQAVLKRVWNWLGTAPQASPFR